MPGPLYQTVLQLLSLFHAAFSIGVAEGGLDDLIELGVMDTSSKRTARPKAR